ncbi:PTS sugar transporter subunit IIB [Faecalitalea cylindroides]|uniref:PTS sugar transporter subunit IIB n=1 Tax=Faecalitalea cylindroides TaxID=39483 RepID=UPI00195A2DA9|nr:PTS sugar transporter subunit IIB [Faecalitalea cylindroides]MBM6653110.1 PTS sugar transporter subunit IIB [Faecalitalea cylindroides]
MIKLVRVDHRLLHGQVIFSWTKQMSVNYIIVADDKVPNDPISVMALNIAKPVDCELSIIPFSQLKELVEEKQNKNIMILVKGPNEALRLIEELPEVTEINYGGVAKKSDSKQFGKAIFLNPQELKATQEIIAKGKKVYIQMVPTSQIESADFSK